MSLATRKAIRHRLFALLLVAVGLVVGVGAVIGLTLAGVLHFDWSDRILKARAEEQARAAERRILALGDSFLSYWPLPITVKGGLVEYGRQHNLGVLVRALGGFGPNEYLDQLRQVGDAYAPHLIIVFTYVGNDFTDVMYRPLDEPPRRPADGLDPIVLPHVQVPPPVPTPTVAPKATPAVVAPVAPSATPPPQPTATPSPWGKQFDWALMRSRGISEEAIRRAQNKEREPGKVDADHMNPYLLDNALAAPRYLLDNLLLDTAETSACTPRVEAIYAQMAQEARRLGAELWVVAFPSTVQLDRSHFQMYDWCRYQWDDRLVGSTAPQDLLRGICARQGIRFLDLLPAFQAQPDTAALYWVNDDHFDAAGHALAWGVVRDHLLDPWRAAQPSRRRVAAAQSP